MMTMMMMMTMMTLMMVQVALMVDDYALAIYIII